MKALNTKKLQQYIDTLIKEGYDQDTIGRKLSSVNKFIEWAANKGEISPELFEQLKTMIASALEKTKRFKLSQGSENIEDLTTHDQPQIQDFETVQYQGEKKTDGLAGEFYFKFNIRTYKIKSFLKGIYKRLPLLGGRETTKTNDLKTNSESSTGYQLPSKLTIQHYIGAFLLLVLIAGLGGGMYVRFFQKANSSFAYPTSLTGPGTTGSSKRFLSFQGRLTDNLGNPIIVATNLQFRLYTAKTGGSTLYDTSTCSLTPDEDGIFDVLIGGADESPAPDQSVCGNGIAATVFTENAQVFLGVKVAGDAEMTPRQQIANVAYALNSETLQGFPPGTAAANIAYINSAGALIAGPSVTATGGSTTYTIKSTATLAGAINSAQTNLYAQYAVPVINLTGGSSNTLTNAYANYSGLTATAGTITNYYGEYVAAPTGGGTVSNKYAFVSESGAGKVGLGTTTPLNQLDVNGAAVIGASYAGTNTAPTSGLLVQGNVGIGTTTTNNKLDVNGSAAFGSYAGTSAPSNGIVVSGNVGVGTTTVSARLHSLSTTEQLRLGYDASNYSAFTIGSSGALTLAQTGTGGAINLTSSLVSGNTTTAALNLKTSTDLASTDEVFQVGDSAADFLTVRGDGNVGIGSIAPGAKLDLNGTLQTNNTVKFSGLGAGTATTVLCLDGSTFVKPCTAVTASSIKLNSILAADNTNTIDNVNFAQAWNWNSLASETAFTFGSTSNSLSTGKLLSVAATQSAATGTSVSADISNISFAPTYSTAVTTPTISGNVLDISRSATTNSSFASTLTVSGAVATIADSATQTTGTLTHTADVLDVTQNYTSSSGTALYVKNYGGSSSNSFRVDDVSGDTSPFIIDAAGNVGVGTTSVASGFTLEDIGRGRFSTGLSIANTSTTSTLDVTGTAGFSTSATTPIVYGGTGASSTLTLAGTSNGSPSNAHIILNGAGQGNVGIGTTTVNATLDVKGTLARIQNAGNTELRIDSNGGTNNNSLLSFYENGVDRGGVYWDGAANNYIWSDALAGSSISLSLTGNFGIGTTSPGAFTDVDLPDASSITAERITLRSAATSQTLTDGTSITNWRANQFIAPTVIGPAGGSTETITSAATAYIDAAPTLTNITNTNLYSLWVDAGNARFDGNIGIGTTAPGNSLVVDGGDTIHGSSGTFNNPSGSEDVYVKGNLEVDGIIYGAVVGSVPLNLISAATADSGTINHSNYQIDWNWSTLASETAFKLGSTSNSLSTGKLLSVAATQSAATGTSVSADISNISFAPTYSTAITTPTISGNVLDISRSATTNSSFASTLTVSGAVATIADSSTQTTGTLTHTADVLDVTQNYTSSSGTALYVKNFGGSSSNSFRVDDGAVDTTPFIVDSAGNVGIGTTSTGAALDVNGNILVQGGGTIDTRTAGSLGIGTATQNALTIGRTSTAGTTLNGLSGSSSIAFGTFTVGTNGQISSSYANSAALNLTGNGAGITFTGSGSNPDQIITSNNNHLALMPNGTGNVGIGTTTPAARLELQSTQTSGTLIKAGASGSVTLAGALTGSNIDLSTSYTNAAQNVTGESIALGTTTAASTTTTKALAITSGAFTNSSGTSTWTGLDLTMPNITQSAGTLTSTGIKITGGTVTSGTSYALLTTASAGNVGIGSATPATLLDVAGTVQTNNTVKFSGLGAGTATSVLCLDGSSFVKPCTTVSATGIALNNITAATADSTTIAHSNYQIDWNWDTLSTQTALKLGSTSNSLSTGKLLSVAATQTAATGTSVSADISNISFAPTYSTAVTTPTISGNVLDISRSATTNSSFASTLTVSGAVATIADSSTQTTGTLTHTADVLDVTQNYTSSSGTALFVKNYGGSSSTSLRVDDVSGDTTPFIVDATGNVGIGTTSTASFLAVAGGVTISSAYTGVAAPSNGLLVSGNVGIGTTSGTAKLSVGSSSSFQVDNSGAVTTTSLDAAANVEADQFLINGTLFIDSGLNISNINNLTINGVTLLNADVTLGDSTGDSLYFPGTVFSDIIPRNNTYNLGDATDEWATLFTNQVCFNAGADCMTAVPTGTIGGSGTPNRLAKFTTSTDIGDSSIVDQSGSVALTIDSAGNFGIGKSFPSEKLNLADGGNLLIDAGNLTTPFGGYGRYENYLTYSQDFNNAAWTKSTNTTVQSTSLTAPDGQSVTTNHVRFAANAATDEIKQDSGSAAGSNTFTGSVWLKYTGSTTVRIGLKDQAGSPSVTSTSVSVTTAWQRFKISKTFSSATGNAVFFIDDAVSSSQVDVYAWGAQVEKQSTLGTYAQTTTPSFTTASYGLTANGTLRATGIVYGASFKDITSPSSAVGLDPYDNGISVDGGVGLATNYGAILAGVSGNLGIGTTTTANKLSVNGSASFGTYSGTAAPSNGLIVSGNVGIGTSTVGEKLEVSGKIKINSGNSTDTLTSPASNGLVLESTGGTYQTVRLTLQNIGGSNGALFEQLSTNGANELVDFGFKTQGGTQHNERFENRSGQVFIAAPEFEFGAAGGPHTVLSGNGVLLRGSGAKLGINNANGAGSNGLPSANFGVKGNASIGSGYYSTSAPTNGLIVEGNIGIGESSPGFPLNFASSTGDKIALYGNTGGAAHYGLGIQANLLQIHTGTGSEDIGFGYGYSASMTRNVTFKGSGEVSIGTTTPNEKLYVDGGNIGINVTSGNNSALNFYEAGTLKADIFWQGASDFLYINSKNTVTAINAGGGNVGIGTTAPVGLFEVKGNAYAREFIQWDSTFDEEFNKEVASSVTADTTLGWGDHSELSVDENTNCTWDIPDDTINGVMKQTATTTSSCLTYTGTSTNNDANLIFDADFKPVIVMKVKPSTTSNHQFWVGISDSATASNANPTNGIFFTNDSTSGTAWKGVTCSGGSCATAVSCGNTISTSQYATLMIRVNSTSSVDFYYDNDASDGITMTSCGTQTTNIPTATLAAMVQNVGASLSTYDLYVDYFRVYQDDAPDGGNQIAQDQSPKALDIYANADIAEAYSVEDPENTPAGLIMSTVAGIMTQKSPQAYDPNMIGVTSHTQSMTLGAQDNSTVPVALTGRVQTFITTKNGPIHAGDPITSSDIPGVGMKATKPGAIVGRALEDYTNTDPTVVGKVLVFINPSSFDPDVHLTSTGDVNISVNDNQAVVRNDSGELITRIGLFAEAAIGKIKSGIIEAKNITTDTLTSLNGSIENLTARNINVQDKIVSPVIETNDLTAHGISKLAQIETKEIKPQEDNVVINLDITPTPSQPNSTGGLAKLIIKGLQGKTVASIDAAGNATFSGTIASNKVETTILAASEASLSGRLVAKRVDSENINALENQYQDVQNTVLNQARNSQQFSDQLNSLQTTLSNIQNQPLPNPQYYQNINQDIVIADSGTFNQLAVANNFTVTGNANIYTAYVVDSLSVANLTIHDNSVITLASDLKFSALNTITLFDNAVVIAKDGTITSKGEVVAQKGIATNKIRSVNPQDDIDVSLNAAPGSNSKLKITNQLGKVTASIDASGSAQFKDIALTNTYHDATRAGALIAAADNLSQYGNNAPALDAQMYTAGNGLIPANSNEVIIYSDKVTNNSLIYLTPSSSSPNSSLTVVKKESCSQTTTCRPYFKVAVANVSNSDVQFNWLIIN